MSDIVKRVLTVFEGDSKSYDKAVDDASKSTQQLADEQKKQQKVQEDSTKSTQSYSSGLNALDKTLGKMVPGLGQVTKGFKDAQKGAESFGKGTAAAIAASGIGILVLVVGKLISTFSELKDKSAEDLTFIESKIVAVGDSVVEWLGGMEKIKTSLVLLGNSIIPGLGSAIADLTAKQVAYNKAIADAKALTEDNLAQATARVAILKAQGAGAQEIFEAELRLLTLRASSAKTDADITKLQSDAVLLRINYEKQLGVEDKKNYDARLKAFSDEQTRIQTEMAVKAEQQATFDAYTQKSLDNSSAQATAELERLKAVGDASLTFTDQEVELQDETASAVVEGARARLAAGKAISKAWHASLIGQQINAAKETIVNTADAIMAIWANPGPFLIKLGQSIALGAIGLSNLNKIRQVQFTAPAFEEGGRIPARSGGMINGRRHYQGGVKFRVGGYAAEAEGGEYIVNRRATKRFLPLIEAINKYEMGGQVGDRSFNDISSLGETITTSVSENRSVLVLEDLRRASKRLDVIENLARV